MGFQKKELRAKPKERQKEEPSHPRAAAARAGARGGGERQRGVAPSPPPPAYPGALLARGKALALGSAFRLRPIKGSGHSVFA